MTPQEPTITAPETTPVTDEPAAEVAAVDEAAVLVEDVSIDGMCGVY